MTGPALAGHDGGEEDGSTLVADYEQLRCAALGRAAVPARGLALVMRSGLAVWMQAAGAVRSCASVSSPSLSRPLTAVPEVAAPDMVTILTQMVMATTTQMRS